MSVLGDNIRQLRDARGLKQAQLGDMLGLAESTISLYEKGKREPDVATIKKMAKIFDVTTDLLLGYDVLKTELMQNVETIAHIRRGLQNDPPISPEDLELAEQIAKLSEKSRQIIDAIIAVEEANQDEKNHGVKKVSPFSS